MRKIKMPFSRRLVLDRRIRGVKPSRIIRRGMFRRVYQYDIDSYRKYKEALGKIDRKTKVISFLGIN